MSNMWWLLLLIVCLCPLITTSTADATVWQINASAPLKSISSDLYGFFFEEINDAGQATLYAQQIATTTFEDSRRVIDPWTVLGATATLSTANPLTPQSPHSLQVVGTNGTVMLSNPGNWGINLRNVTAMKLSFFAYSPPPSIGVITAALQSTDGKSVYGQVNIDAPTAQWQQYSAVIPIVANTDAHAVFTLTWQLSGKQQVNFDIVSLFRDENWRGLSFVKPLVADAIAQMFPSFLRFPGGCYVEGDKLEDRFNWLTALGPMQNRSGHWDLWGYWSEDALGIYEYLLFIEQLKDAYGQQTRAVWVVNAGMSHTDRIEPADLGSWIQSAANSIEFAIGDAKTTTWGSYRAALGHPEPFIFMTAVSIGNEGCNNGRGHNYTENYRVMYPALKKMFPQIMFIANCEQPPDITEVFEFHMYATEHWYVVDQHRFDTYNISNGRLFASEYAVTDYSLGSGQMSEAVVIAAYMMGLERNSPLVWAMCFGVAIANTQWDNPQIIPIERWYPRLIMTNNHDLFFTPVAYVHMIFQIPFMGVAMGSVTQVRNTVFGDGSIALSVTRGRINAGGNATNTYIHKIVNLNATRQSLHYTLALPLSATLLPTMDWWELTGASDAVNDYTHPTAVAPTHRQTAIKSASFDVDVPPNTIWVWKIYTIESQTLALA